MNIRIIAPVFALFILAVPYGAYADYACGTNTCTEKQTCNINQQCVDNPLLTGSTTCGSQTCALGETCTADPNGSLYCAGGVRTNTPIVNTGPNIGETVVNTGPNTGGSLFNPLGNNANLDTLLASILAFVVRIGAVVVVLMLVYVGFLFVTARGNESSLTTAKAALLWTVVGALILLGAQAIAIAIRATVQAISVGG